MTDEPNTPDVEETMDTFLDENDQPQVSSPETDQPAVETPEQPPAEEGSVTDTPKTEEPSDKAEDYTDTPKGFAEHPAWQKREQKLKDALEGQKTAEEKASLHDSLLGDPVIYKRFLQQKGFSDNKINELMKEKGFTVEEPSGAKESIAERTCKALGWDMNSLDQKQKAHINDLIRLNEVVAKDIVQGILKDRLGPMEDFVKTNQTRSRLAGQKEEAQNIAKDEFPQLDWNKDIEPAMHKYLDELEKKDPNAKTDMLTLYERATRQLMKEQNFAQARQEDRNAKKVNARPITPGAVVKTPTGVERGADVEEDVDKFLDASGFKG